MTTPRSHGRPARGLAHGGPPRSRLTQGRFGRLFPELPPLFHRRDALVALGAAMTAGLDAAHEPPDAEENPGIEAAYTYFGQFVDHDLTFDPNSIAEQVADPDALVDFRTPRFDLDSVYGRGPNDQPYLYQADGVSMLLGRPLSGSSDTGARDLPRTAPEGESLTNPARALIGDPRNDENRIVSQLHATVLRFHNAIAELVGGGFEAVRQEVVNHYQWVVLHDFLPRIIGADQLNALYPGLDSGLPIDAPHQLNLSWYHPERSPYMPLEFSGAAYRFGHSMIRPDYRLNQTIERQFIFDVGQSAPPPADSLAGFRRMPDDWAIDWRFFLSLPGAAALPDGLKLQHSYKIDTSLVDPLGHLPPSIASEPPASLAARNLIRGQDYQLPSGQAVARRIGQPVVDDAHLMLGKIAAPDDQQAWQAVDAAFHGRTPLWAYILCEAMQPAVLSGAAVDHAELPVRLGPVGATIVGEVFLGLLAHDPSSYPRADPSWRPRADLSTAGTFGLAELVNAAL